MACVLLSIIAKLLSILQLHNVNHYLNGRILLFKMFMGQLDINYLIHVSTNQSQTVVFQYHIMYMIGLVRESYQYKNRRYQSINLQNVHHTYTNLVSIGQTQRFEKSEMGSGVMEE